MSSPLQPGPIPPPDHDVTSPQTPRDGGDLSNAYDKEEIDMFLDTDSPMIFIQWLSMHSFMGKLNLAAGDESPKLPLPSPSGSLARRGSLEGGAVALFDMEFAGAEFSEAEKKKIMANERLAEDSCKSTVCSKIKRAQDEIQVLQTEATRLSPLLELLGI